MLTQMTQVLKQLAEARPVEDAALPAPRHGENLSLPDTMQERLELLERMLTPLARNAKRTLQGGTDTLKAVQVWKQVNEALEVLSAIQGASIPAGS